MFFVVTVGLSTIGFVVVIVLAFFFGVVGFYMVIGVVVIVVIGFVGVTGRVIAIGCDAGIIVVVTAIITGRFSDGVLGMFIGSLKELS